MKPKLMLTVLAFVCIFLCGYPFLQHKDDGSLFQLLTHCSSAKWYELGLLIFIFLPAITPVIASCMFFLAMRKYESKYLYKILVIFVPLLWMGTFFAYLLSSSDYKTFIIFEHIFFTLYIPLLFLFLIKLKQSSEGFYCGVIMLIIHFIFVLPLSYAELPKYAFFEYSMFLICAILIIFARKSIIKIPE